MKNREFLVSKELVLKEDVERLLIGVGVPKALIENLPVYEALTASGQVKIDNYALYSGFVSIESLERRTARELGEFIWKEGMCEKIVETDDSLDESVITTRINIIRKKEG